MKVPTNPTMKIQAAALVLFAASGLCLLLSGCTVVALGGVLAAEGAMHGAAMRPYDQALARGRMTPVEYRQQMAQVDRGMEAMFCPPAPVARRR